MPNFLKQDNKSYSGNSDMPSQPDQSCSCKSGIPFQHDQSCSGKSGIPPSLINPAQAKQAIRQTKEICEKSSLDRDMWILRFNDCTPAGSASSLSQFSSNHQFDYCRKIPYCKTNLNGIVLLLGQFYLFKINRAYL